MNEDRSKRLSEFLGHKDVTNYSDDDYHKCSCGKEFHMTKIGSEAFDVHLNPSFTTSDDVVKLVKRLMATGKWINFFDFLKAQYEMSVVVDRTSLRKYYEGFTSWLITDFANTCDLVGQFLEGEK